ncbi:conjugal transfer protein TraF [Thiocystis minor]|uniref:conjugal transfer protein TraF n=1 Tax=Thiocystis minor TaxID=61597 RepID=UPI001914574E|nr:conjugal transfer protein TraF [Thiocystis minor]MBK5962698.1 conjugal transfer protein TraF [Thiocystis minor]
MRLRRAKPRQTGRALLALGLSGALLAALAQDAPRFYERSAEGWFWYQAELPVPVPIPDPEPVPPITPEPLPPSIVADATAPPPLSAAWLRANLERYQQQAIDDPSPTKVALYLYLQKIALDKASRFTDAFQRVVQSDPALDETTRQPVGNYANLLNRVAGQHREAVLKALAGEAGIWFFYRSDCPYCAAQATVLQVLADQQGFTVQAIALDGQPLPKALFPDFRRDAGQAERLGVVSTPALFLVRPPAGIVPLAQGLLSLNDLQQRLVLAARDVGWIDEATYARTKPTVADRFLEVAFDAPLDVPADPAVFLDQLRARASGDAPVFAPTTPFTFE